MKRVHATASFGFVNGEHEDDFEFEDDVTETEIIESIYNWATEFIDIDYYEIEED